MYKVINYNLCIGGLSKSTSVSDAQNFFGKIQYGNKGIVCDRRTVLFCV